LHLTGGREKRPLAIAGDSPDGASPEPARFLRRRTVSIGLTVAEMQKPCRFRASRVLDRGRDVPAAVFHGPRRPVAGLFGPGSFTRAYFSVINPVESAAEPYLKLKKVVVCRL